MQIYDSLKLIIVSAHLSLLNKNIVKQEHKQEPQKL